MPAGKAARNAFSEALTSKMADFVMLMEAWMASIKGRVRASRGSTQKAVAKAAEQEKKSRPRRKRRKTSTKICNRLASAAKN